MNCGCATVRTLKQLADASPDPHMAGAAAASLAIIADVHEAAMSGLDIALLHDLVDAIHHEGQLGMLKHLRTDAPDCRVCAALALRMAEVG